MIINVNRSGLLHLEQAFLFSSHFFIPCSSERKSRTASVLVPFPGQCYGVFKLLLFALQVEYLCINDISTYG